MSFGDRPSRFDEIERLRGRISELGAENERLASRMSWATGNVALSHDENCECGACAMVKLDMARREVARLEAEVSRLTALVKKLGLGQMY